MHIDYMTQYGYSVLKHQYFQVQIFFPGRENTVKEFDGQMENHLLK